MFEIWGRIAEEKLVDVKLDSIMRSQDDVSIVSFDEWVTGCRSAVDHGRLHVLYATRPGGGTRCIDKTLVKKKMLPKSEVPK